jgi:transcriptional regulator with XRE-family HTH domain
MRLLNIGELLRDSRQQADVSDVDLAKRTGASVRYVRSVERGERQRVAWSRLQALAAALPGTVLARAVQEESDSRVAAAAEDPAQFKRLFGDLLRTSRTRAGLGLRELAARVGMNASYLSKVELSHAAPPTEKKIVAIVRELPGTEIAAVMRRRHHVERKLEVLSLTEQLLELLGVMRYSEFDDDDELRRELRSRLETALATLGKP